RETVAVWETGADATPLGRAIVWQDRRTMAECEKLKKQRLEPWIQKRTGLLLDPYFSATKMAWRLREEPALRKKCLEGSAKFGTMESYLLYRMTQGGSHKTDITNAS